GPYDGLNNGDPCHHIYTHLSAFCFHPPKNSNGPCESVHQQTAGNNDCLTDNHQLFNIINSLIFPAGSKTLSHNSHKTDTNANSGNSVKVFQNIGHGLGRNGGCTHGGDGGLDGQLSKLKHTIFNTRWNTQRKNTADHRPIRTDLQVIPYM